jgi:transitional endoplasmic reticulum ATPase
MERFTGADIQAVYTEAAISAMKRCKGEVGTINSDDFETALNATKPSVTIKMLREYETLSEQFTRRSKPAKVEEVTERPVLGWQDVAGLEDVKEALHEAIEMPLTHPELLKQYGVKATKGILLFGPPGCGKTFLAKVVASEAKAHFINVKGPELLKGVVGESESRMRDLFVRARENRPCVLFFDEIDSFAGARGTSNESSSKILTQFLTEMDGAEELKGVVVLGATNRPYTLDPALLRPGRFDKMLYVPPPDRDARIALFVSELKNKPMEVGIGYGELADATDGYSAADIESICNAAAMSAAKLSLKAGIGQSITTQELVSRIARTPSSLTKEETEMYEAIRKQFERQ